MYSGNMPALPVYRVMTAGLVAALVPADSHAAFFAGTDLNQVLVGGSNIGSVGGMNGVYLENQSAFFLGTPRFFFRGGNGNDKSLQRAAISTSSLPFGTLLGESTEWTNELDFLSREQPNPAGSLPICGAAYGAGSGFFGVRFERRIPFSTTAVTNYGWIQVSAIDNGCEAPIATLLGWGWDDTGATVFTGQTAAVPEPSTLAMLAMGGLAGAALRRRRRASSEHISA